MNGPASEHQERLERFVCRENVAHFRRLLTTESDEAERDLLFKLLVEEQEKPSISRSDQDSSPRARYRPAVMVVKHARRSAAKIPASSKTHKTITKQL